MIDLFNQVDPVLLKDELRVHLGDWVNVLLLPTLERTKKLMKLFKEETTYCPDYHDILKAYKTLNYEDVRVVILGQDPYHSPPEQATGLAFACGVKVSPSLKKMLPPMMKADNIDVDYVNENIEEIMKLEHLPKQGVMLLNTILTVEKGMPKSHKDIGWHILIEDTIHTLGMKEDVIFLLWGNPAKAYKKLIKKAKVLTAEHPVAASYAERKWRCNHFEQVNELLKKPIKWIKYD